MAKAKTIQAKSIQAFQMSKAPMNKKAAKSRVGKLPDARADVPFDDDIAGKYYYIKRYIKLKIFPRTVEDRAVYINPKTKRKMTEFQFKVLDLCSQIPKGKVTTYKKMADALNSSPRAIGGVMRINPFCPLPVPCHRVVASDGFLGGFNGQWGAGGNMRNKRAKLEKEGCQFNAEGFIVADKSGEIDLFEDFDTSKL